MSDEIKKGPWAPSTVPYPTRSQLANFLEKINIVGPNGCWEWQGMTNENGYGRFHIGLHEDRRLVYVHRLAFSIWYDDDLDGLSIDHTCKNKRCCNPAHLEKCTVAENVHMRHTRTAEENEMDYYEMIDEEVPF